MPYCLVVCLLGGLSFLSGSTLGAELPPLEGRQNLAAGRSVLFAPAPDYRLTAQGDSDATDLTDGKLTKRADRKIWFERSAVGWSYGGRVNLAVDLGQMSQIDEVAIRLLGGSEQPGISLPVWVEALVSPDGEQFEKVAEFSRWNPGDNRRYGIPEDAGKSWIHCLRFTDLKARGRWVGLRMYTTGLSASDELYVFGKPATEGQKSPTAAASDFSVTRPQPYFHKPSLVVATNVTGPVPVGVVVPTATKKGPPVQWTVELPAGVDLLAAVFGKNAAEAKPETSPDGRRRYSLALPATASNKTAGRLYVRATGWKDGQQGVLRHWSVVGGKETARVEVPLAAVEVPAAPRLKRMMAGLGWWSAAETARWPGALDSWQRMGLNTFSLFPVWMKEKDPLWDLVEEARQRGFFIAAIDSTFHQMVNRHRKDEEIFHQMADGSHSEQLCPSYRGPYYQEELKRFARQMAQARPDFVSLDIELWGWRGPVDSRKCRRCQEDFKASGLASWEEWMVAKGSQMWRELVEGAWAESSKGGKKFEIGGYDFRPGPAYQGVWSVDRLYPKWMQSSQVSTYSSLLPYHLALVGDEARKDRAALPRSDVLPWLTPGDGGTFPAECFQWALLECYLNGARGVWFWSSRLWDMEDLVAYNRVVRAIAPVEDLLLEGQLAGDAVQVVGPGRVSGIRRGDEMVLLAADYAERAGGKLSLRLRVPKKSDVYDLIARRAVGTIDAGGATLEIPVKDARARLLHVRPVSSARP